MPWRLLPRPSKEDYHEEFERKTKFLVDESLGPDVAIYLREHGYNAKFVSDVGLNGHDDRDLFAYAWRTRRVLLLMTRTFWTTDGSPSIEIPVSSSYLAATAINRRWELELPWRLLFSGRGPPSGRRPNQ